MDWIHCNVCFLQPSREKAFSLTSCGHMFCNDCLGNGIGTKNVECKICQSKCACIQLVQDMEPNVKEFFAQPEDILTKLMQVLDFQKKHRMKLTAHWLLLNQKYEEAKGDICRLQEITRKLYNSLKELHKQNKALKTALSSNSHGVHQVPATPLISPPMPTPMYYSSVKPNHSTIQNTACSQSFSSKFVTPNRVNKQRNVNGSAYSVKRGCNMMRSADVVKPQFNECHSFLTPPNDTPPTVFKYVRN